MKIPSISIVIAAFALLVGCGKQSVSSGAASSPVSEVMHQPVSSAAQAVLDGLTVKCSSPVWCDEFDRIERPETRPTNLIVSGEVSAFLSDSKKRLADLGVKIKWNHEKKIYEMEGDTK